MSYSFDMTDVRIKKLRENVIKRHPDVVCLSSPTQKRKAADLVMRSLRIDGKLEETYLQQVITGSISDLELFDMLNSKKKEVPESLSKPVERASRKRQTKVPKLVHFSPEALTELSEVAERLDCSTSFLVRQAVDAYLKGLK